jgi:hypothetical protein
MKKKGKRKQLRLYGCKSKTVFTSIDRNAGKC